MNRLCLAAAFVALAGCYTPEAEQDVYAEEAIVVTAARKASAGVMAYAPPPEPAIREQYEKTDPNPVKLVTEEPVSTFSSDVDTTSYAVARRYIMQNNALPPSDSVRPEEFVNYFDYQYREPESAESPFEPTLWVTTSPWNAGTRLLHIGVKGFEIEP